MRRGLSGLAKAFSSSTPPSPSQKSPCHGDSCAPTPAVRASGHQGSRGIQCNGTRARSTRRQTTFYDSLTSASRPEARLPCPASPRPAWLGRLGAEAEAAAEALPNSRRLSSAQRPLESTSCGPGMPASLRSSSMVLHVTASACAVSIRPRSQHARVCACARVCMRI